MTASTAAAHRFRPTAGGAGTPDADALVADNLPLVGYLVAELAGRLPSHVALDDLRSAGLAALVESARSYDASRGVPFPRYASIRLRGAMVDELRGQDWASRSVRLRVRERDAAAEQLAAALGRRPSAAELAAHLGVPVAQLHSTEDDAHRGVVLSLQGLSGQQPGLTVDDMLSAHEPSPEQEVLERERVGYLVDAVAVLPERLRQVVSALYLQERTVTEVAAELGVTESRVSQLRSEALAMLRDGINSGLDPDRVAAPERPGGCVDRRRQEYFSAVANRSTCRARLESRPAGFPSVA